MAPNQWEVDPEGIYEALTAVSDRYDLPIIITENGVDDARDERREKYIADHLRWTHAAIEAGADVRGYVYWSLLDNFEWAEGFSSRFGLLEVDYDSPGLERRLRASAISYGRTATMNELDWKSGLASRR